MLALFPQNQWAKTIGLIQSKNSKGSEISPCGYRVNNKRNSVKHGKERVQNIKLLL
jgi:hypothetical protein